ncbi:MAG: hypothetical protein ISR77_33450 [Pirellulaceae bacterium]|nr:hypothetical protein [Pirellulaceae bacterium]
MRSKLHVWGGTAGFCQSVLWERKRFDRLVLCVVASGLVLVTVATSLCAQGVVARVRVDNTAGEELSDVVVRGALPLPADYGKPVGRIALRYDGKVLPTQSTVFSTYPGSDDKHPVGRPEIIHLAAKVPALPAGMSELEIVELAAEAKANRAKPGKAVATWLAGELAVVVEATDCFGHRYRASVLDAAHRIETRQAGPVLTEEVYQAILTPTDPSTDEAKPTLKRFLRVRAYLTTYDGEEFASLALMIHNGSIDQPNGDVYYRQIRVGVPASMGLGVWKKRFSPASGVEAVTEGQTIWQSCPPPSADGKVFVMPARSAAVLRAFVHAPPMKKRRSSSLPTGLCWSRPPARSFSVGPTSAPPDTGRAIIRCRCPCRPNCSSDTSGWSAGSRPIRV